MKKNLLFILLSFCAFCVFTAIGGFLVFTSSNQNSDSATWFYCYAYANGGSISPTGYDMTLDDGNWACISNDFNQIYSNGWNYGDYDFSECYYCYTTSGKTIYLPNVSWSGNTFLGWWYQYSEPADPNNYGNEYIRSSTTYDWNRNYDTPSSTRYYIAVWQVNYYTLTITTSGPGSVSTTSISVPGGSSLNASGNSLRLYNSLTHEWSTISTASALNNDQWSSSFTGWTIGWSGVDQNKTITANFSGSEKTYWTNINIYSPDNVEDYASGTMTVNYNGSYVYGVSNEDDRQLPYSGYIQISSISPATGMHLSSVSGATDQGNGVYRRTVGTGGEINIYMAWNTYSVVYNANGGSGTAPGPQNNIKYNENLELLGNTFTRTGYTFLGWNTSSTATSASYSAGQSVSRLTSTNGATVNLYAIWKRNNYNVTLNTGSNGFLRTFGSTDNLGTSKTWTVPYNSSFSGGGTNKNIWISGYFDINAIANMGYTFVSWDKSGGDTTPAYNLTVTATIRANAYTIEFNSNGGSGSMSDLPMTYNVGKNLTKNTFTNNGKVFAGWSTSSSATSPTYYDNQYVSNLTSEDYVAVTLYAVWLDCYTSGTLTQPLGGGTEINPYKVSSASELAWIANEVNFNNRKGIYIQQTANITLSSDLHWNPIGTIDNPFYGFYDGQGFIIDGLTTKSDLLDGQGLFGYVGGVVMEGVARGATIKNVRLINANIVSRYDAGAIVGRTMNSSSQYPTLIQNCFIRANVSGQDDTGGIIGQTGSYTTIENCVFIGLVNGDDDEYVAAVLPYIVDNEENGNTVVIKNVYVESNCYAFYDEYTGTTTNVIGKQNGSKYIYSSNGFEDWIISADGTPLPGGFLWIEDSGKPSATTEDIQNWKNS